MSVFEIGTDGPTSMLLAIDGSDTSLRAASYAAGNARRQGAKLIVLFVHATPGLAPMSPAADVAMRASNNEIAQERIEAAKTRTAELGIHVTFIEREGDPFDEIVRLATEKKVDVI